MTEPTGRAVASTEQRGSLRPSDEGRERVQGTTEASRLVVCSPLGLEARAVRRGLGDGGEVRRTGYGPARAARRAAELRHGAFKTLAVAGVGGGVSADLRLGDVVVGTEVSRIGSADSVTCASAALLAGELRRAGLRATAGKIVTVDHLFRSGQREQLVSEGAVAVDMESALLLEGAAGRPAVVVRAISDTPQRPLLGPWAVPGGIAALKSLRLAAPALARWAAACAPRRVLLAGPRSFCAGVERAIEIVERVLERHGPPVYVRKQIVHNKVVVTDLEGRGAIFVDELDQVPDGAIVVFSAHGVSPEVRRNAEERGLQAIDATCPLVSKVHVEARRFAAEGYQVALIGHAGHEEVEGTLGEAPQAMTLVETIDDVARLQPRDPDKLAFLMQTTLSADEASGIADALLERFPAARRPGSDDICYATTNRQLAVRAIADESDVLLVAGSANSSNSKRLVEVAERAGTPAHLIDGPEDIELSWLTGASVVGLTAGASAPPAVVGQIIDALSGLGPVEVSERVVATESIRFGLPKELKQ
jgi:4-hydroxy-3-methylbut-2-enyl diphosphate reductase